MTERSDPKVPDPRDSGNPTGEKKPTGLPRQGGGR
jgi:hypothetical protein